MAVSSAASSGRRAVERVLDRQPVPLEILQHLAEAADVLHLAEAPARKLILLHEVVELGVPDLQGNTSPR